MNLNVSCSLDSDSSLHGIGREMNKSTYKKTPSDNEEKTSEQDVQ